jgi:hypothetical protein
VADDAVEVVVQVVVAVQPGLRSLVRVVDGMVHGHLGLPVNPL